MGFSWSCLPIGKNGTVVALNSFIDHGLDFAAMIDILLGIFFGKKVVKMKWSFRVVFIENNLFFFAIDHYAAIFVPILDLWLQ